MIIKKLGEGVWWKNGTFWIILSPFIAMLVFPLILLQLGYLEINTNRTTQDYYEFGIYTSLVVGGGFLLALLLKKLKQRRKPKDD